MFRTNICVRSELVLRCLRGEKTLGFTRDPAPQQNPRRCCESPLHLRLLLLLVLLFEYIVFTRAGLPRVSVKLFFMIPVAELNIRTLYTSISLGHNYGGVPGSRGHSTVPYI